MSNYNRVILIGNLCHDPELKYTGSGTAVSEWAIAVNEKRKAKDGSLKEEVSFIDVTCFGRTAEMAAEYLKKGRSVLVEGRLKQERWETEDGKKRSKLKVIADRVQFMSGKKEGGEGVQADAPATAADEDNL